MKWDQIQMVISQKKNKTHIETWLVLPQKIKIKNSNKLTNWIKRDETQMQKPNLVDGESEKSGGYSGDE